MARNPHRRPLRPIDFHVLAVLQDGPLHGYALAQEVSERSRGRLRVRPGDLYRVLYRLAEQDLIQPESQASAADRRRTRYRLTAVGRDVLRREARQLIEVATRVLRDPAAEGTS